MAANIAAIFPRKANISWVTMQTGTVTKDGTNASLLFTADATNGSRLDRIRMRPMGNCVASVARFYINNGSTNATIGNNSLVWDVTLPAITNSEIAAQMELELQCNVALPAGYRIYVSIGTGAASPDVMAGWAFTAIGGDY